MKFAYLIYFPYLCANNMQEQTVIYLFMKILFSTVN